MLDDFPQLLRKVENLKREHDEAKGGLTQLLKRVKKEFGCNSVKEFEELYEKYRKMELKAAVKITKTKKALLKKHRKVLK